LDIPPPKIPEWLLKKEHLLTVGEEEFALDIPAPDPAEVLVVFSEKVQLITVDEEELLYIPPPSPLAEFPVKLQLVTIGEESTLDIPPPL
jgi:hypothetical protein